MSNHSELRDLRSEVIHFKNKCKSMILKSTLMPQIKEAFVGSQCKYKIYITISTQFCSDVSFIGTIFLSNWHLSFVLSFFLISDLSFVFLLLSVLVSLQPGISNIFFRITSEYNCSPKNVLLIIKHILRTN